MILQIFLVLNRKPHSLYSIVLPIEACTSLSAYLSVLQIRVVGREMTVSEGSLLCRQLNGPFSQLPYCQGSMAALYKVITVLINDNEVKLSTNQRKPISTTYIGMDKQYFEMNLCQELQKCDNYLREDKLGLILNILRICLLMNLICYKILTLNLLQDFNIFEKECVFDLLSCNNMFIITCILNTYFVHD